MLNKLEQKAARILYNSTSSVLSEALKLQIAQAVEESENIGVRIARQNNKASKSTFKEVK